MNVGKNDVHAAGDVANKHDDRVAGDVANKHDDTDISVYQPFVVRAALLNDGSRVPRFRIHTYYGDYLLMDLSPSQGITAAGFSYLARACQLRHDVTMSDPGYEVIITISDGVLSFTVGVMANTFPGDCANYSSLFQKLAESIERR
jgi:hypothetical protein